jgi:glutathione S-transferase
MEVYADPITVNCRKVLAGLQLMGVDYNLNKVDYFQSEQKGPSYVAINPDVALPAIRDDSLTL